MKLKILNNIVCLLFSLYLGFVKGSYGPLNNIPTILQEFKIHQPITQNILINAKDFRSIVKSMYLRGQRIQFSQNAIDQPYQSYLIFTKLSNFKWNLTTYAPILVVSRIQNEIELNQVDVPIGAQVLFLDYFSLKVYESYTINMIHVTRYLGQFQGKNKGKHQLTFYPNKDYSPSLEKRRKNFYGLQIKVVTSMSRKSLAISDSAVFSNQETFFPNTDDYDVTNFVTISENMHRLNNPVLYLKWMETKLNFTAKIFLRKDMKLGSPKVLSNGSIVIGEGAFRDMFERSVEIICESLVMNPERAHFGTFLPPLDKLHEEIFVPKKDSAEYLDFYVFMKPFSTEMWIALFIKCIIFSIFAYTIEWFHNYKLVRH